MKPPWFLASNCRLSDCPSELRRCLTETGSLTRRLSGYTQRPLSLRLLNQGWTKPTLVEAQILGLPQQRYAMIREIAMGYDDRLWLYARSVFPPQAFAQRRHLLSRLHVVPLANVLFSDRNIKRMSMCLSKLQRPQLAGYDFFSDGNLLADDLWSRHAIYTVEDAPFLLQEIFLPDLSEDIA